MLRRACRRAVEERDFSCHRRKYAIPPRWRYCAQSTLYSVFEHFTDRTCLPRPFPTLPSAGWIISFGNINGAATTNAYP